MTDGKEKPLLAQGYSHQGARHLLCERVQLRKAGGTIYKVRIALAGPAVSHSLAGRDLPPPGLLTPNILASAIFHTNGLSVNKPFSASSESPHSWIQLFVYLVIWN